MLISRLIHRCLDLHFVENFVAKFTVIVQQTEALLKIWVFVLKYNADGGYSQE